MTPIYNSWRSERSECSHSQVIKIEICDIYMYSTYVRIYTPGGSHRRLAAEWKVAGSSPAVELCFFSLSLFFILLSFFPFPLFLSSLPFISPPSFFPFMLAPPLQCSSIFLVIVLTLNLCAMGESVVLFEINGILKLAMVSKIVQAQRVQFGNLEKATQIAQLAHLSQVNSRGVTRNFGPRRQ